MLKQDKVYKDQ